MDKEQPLDKVPLGSQRGKRLGGMTDEQVAVLYGEWQASYFLKNHSFFEMVQSEHDLRRVAAWRESEKMKDNEKRRKQISAYLKKSVETGRGLIDSVCRGCGKTYRLHNRSWKKGKPKCECGGKIFRAGQAKAKK